MVQDCLWNNEGVTQKMDCTADLLLVFVWDKTASGTARSNIGNGMECLFSVLLLPVTEVVSSHTETRSRSAVQSILSLAPRCLRGSLVPYKSEEHQFCGALHTERTVCGMPVTCHQCPKPQPQTLPLLTPSLCTVDWLTKKEPKKKSHKEDTECLDMCGK